ncbi:MAG: lamin tail domain-containing protein [Bacteroidales bacterium]
MKNNYLILMMLTSFLCWNQLDGQQLPQPGELIITEIMSNPAAVDDTRGEWVEIWNGTDHPILLNDLVIKDNGSNRHIISSSVNLVIQPGAYWVLGREADMGLNGGVLVDYVLKNFSLTNSADEVIICLPDERIIDQVAYQSGWPLVSGASMELSPESLNAESNDQPAAWFVSTAIYGAGDRGTPGRANLNSSSRLDDSEGFWIEVYPNPSQGRFILEAEFGGSVTGEIRMINLIGQDFLYRRFGPARSLCEILEPSFLTPGIWFIEVTAGRHSRVVRLIIE